MKATPESVRTPRDTEAESFEEVERHTIHPTVTHEVSIDETEDGHTEITVPISSTTEHRSGGKMTELALESMVEQLEEGTVGMWDDHGLDEYGWPEYRREDMYGWWVGGYIEDDVLWATARLRDGDSRSADLVDQLEQGMPVGFSVGYYPEKDEWVEREDGEVREIIDVDLLECSPVGIPDNQDAYANAGLTIASALAEAGVQVDRHSADLIATSVTDALQQMSDTDNDPDSSESHEADEDEEEESNSNETREATAEEAATAIIGIYEAHMTAAQEDVEEWLEENAEVSESDDEGEEDEESAEGDKDDDYEDEENSAELEELRAELAELRAEKEELETKVDRVESETRESAGRKGMSPPTAETESADGESEESDRSGRGAPRNTLEEAKLLTEN